MENWLLVDNPKQSHCLEKKKRAIVQVKHELGYFLGYGEKPPKENPLIWEYLN